MTLNIVIVGAGIGGLATAIGLRRQGHKVTIYERRPASRREDSGSGVTLQASVRSILEEWNILVDIPRIAHDSELTTFRSANGEIVNRFDFRHRGQLWFGLRSALKDLFREHALQAGATLLEGVNVAQINAQTPSIVLADGTHVEADLILGADGARSFVRQTLFPRHSLTILDSACFQVVVPLDQVRSDRLLSTLLDDHHNTVYTSPGRVIFASPSPSQGVYDMQGIDELYSKDRDSNPNQLVERWDDLTLVKERFSDHSSAVLKALDLGTSVLKWRFTEVNDLPAWSSANGRIALVGDSKHNMTPCAGQGTSMCIEDAAALAYLLPSDISPSALPAIMQQYEAMRRPRCEKMKDLSRALGRSWTLSDARQIEQRNAGWRWASDPEKCRARYEAAEPDINARFGSPAFEKWQDTTFGGDIETLLEKARRGAEERAKL